MYMHKKLREIPYSQGIDRKEKKGRKVKNPWKKPN